MDGILRLEAIGVVRSELSSRRHAPRQGDERAPDATVEVARPYASALDGIEAGDELFVITFLHEADRESLQVRPRDDPSRPLTGVFATRSADRPNPLGLHRVTVREVAGTAVRVGPLEAIDGTPVLDLKPVLRGDVTR